ncbi:uncharacterized protein PWA37_000911 [Arxiozyma heterogenica]|uniref:uncharacterized protein n=1 Tax=Arxiozyma heterogenica TaxID=278026 RepID=UPI002F05C76B
MVFGFIKKERRVPDLSRYDYYYQQNNLDYNKSHRLSTAAASAAAAIRSGSNSPVLNTHSFNSRRTQSMIYDSNPYTHVPHTNSNIHINTRSVSKDLRRKTINNNNNIQSKQKIKGRHENNHGDSNINYKKTYSLRSRSTFDRNIDLSSMKQRNNNHNNNNNNIRSKSSGSTTIPTAVNQRRLNSLSSTNGRSSRLNSLTSNGNARRLKRQQQQQQQQINNPNNILGQSSRTNSITTTVTRVTDPLGRTTSITKKTIKRIDGYEYVETTTTTTNLVPLNELADDDDNNNINNKLLNPSIQKHFDEFSDNFNMTEDEDHDSTMLNDIGNNTMDTNDNTNNLSLTNETDSYHDELIQDSSHYNNIDDTLDNGTLQELDEDLSLPKEIIEETAYDINMKNNNNIHNTSANDSTAIDGTPGYEYDNLLLDDIVEEDEKVSQDDEIEELEKELDKDLHDGKGYNSNIHNHHDDDYQDENKEYTVDDKFDQMEIQNKHFTHPYVSGLIPLDETSSLSKFSDTMGSMPSSKENLVLHKSNISKGSSISTTTHKSNNNRTSMTSKRPVKKKSLLIANLLARMKQQ